MSQQQQTELPFVPQYVATSPKRKQIYQDTVTALSSHGTTTTPPGGNPPPAKKPKQESSSDEVEINWAERKSLIEEHPNDLFMEPLKECVLDVFKNLSTEFCKTPGTGPSMLWHVLPAVMSTIESTPWAAFKKVENPENKPLVFLVNYTWGDRGHDLTPNQKKFRTAILNKVKTKLLAEFQKIMAEENIQVAYSKRFFKGLD